jgi:hypothetical protein
VNGRPSLQGRAAAVTRMPSSSSVLIRRDTLRPPRVQIGQADLIEPVDPLPDGVLVGGHQPGNGRRQGATGRPMMIVARRTRPTRSWTPHQIRSPSHIPLDAQRVIAAGCRGYGGRERAGKFVLTKGAGGNYHITLVTPNGQVIRHQRDLPARAGGAERDRNSKEEAPHAEIDNQSGE